MSNPNEPRYKAAADRAYILKAIENFANLKPDELVKSCLNCDNFIEKSETCKKFNARPPARIIAFSCEAWENLDDDIPF